MRIILLRGPRPWKFRFGSVPRERFICCGFIVSLAVAAWKPCREITQGSPSSKYDSPLSLKIIFFLKTRTFLYIYIFKRIYKPCIYKLDFKIELLCTVYRWNHSSFKHYGKDYKITYLLIKSISGWFLHNLIFQFVIWRISYN